MGMRGDFNRRWGYRFATWNGRPHPAATLEQSQYDLDMLRQMNSTLMGRMRHDQARRRHRRG